LLSKEKIKTDYGVDVPHWKTGLEKCINELKAIN
jgi:dTDP-4-dehydrorhamnose reductase